MFKASAVGKKEPIQDSEEGESSASWQISGKSDARQDAIWKLKTEHHTRYLPKRFPNEESRDRFHISERPVAV